MVITVANQKGGVGKSTVAHNIGIALAQKNKKILFIDTDPQGDLTLFAGSDELEYEGTTKEVLEEIARIKDVKLPIKKNIDIVIANAFLSMTEKNLSDPYALKNSISEVLSEYDYIVIDCPPNLSILTINAFVAADRVIIPTKTDYASYRKIDVLYDTLAEVNQLYNPTVEVMGVVANFYKTISNDDNAILQNLEKNYNVLGIIKDRVIVKSGVLDGLSVIEIDPKDEVSKEYKRIANKILKEVL